ncbi:MAG: hypothetical protein J7K68_03865 [Candidatus Diapherotrites archaeon]|nr:hypothetical protein [Candidatus Diapherotrites archaeon]
MKCAICGAKLHGVSNKGSKTQKRPTRIFAGVLCHRCVRELVTIKTRIKNNTIKEEDVDPRFIPYLKQMK